MANTPVQAFLSYAHTDDDFLKGGITWLRDELQRAMQALTGDPLRIFQESEGVFVRSHWPNQIEDALTGTSFLVPLISPSYFVDVNCRHQFLAFLDLEKRSGRQDLIWPIYLIEAGLLEDPKRRINDVVANAIYKIQCIDWRESAFELQDLPQVKQNAFELAKQIKAASERTLDKDPPLIPEQRNYYRFRINEHGQIDRAPDDAPEVDDADPEMLAQQAGMLDACNRFLDAFRESGAGQNAFGRLINVVDAYQGTISGPLSQIRYSEVWRLGSRLQNAADAARRCIERLEAPELEDEQQAALDDLLAEHGPFILQTPAGREQQALADRFNATKAEQEAKRAAGLALNEAIQADDSLFAEPAKQIIAEVSAEEGEGRHPERHAVIAETTYQNLLAITGKVAKLAGKGAAFAAGAAATGVIGNAAYDNLPLAKDLLHLAQPTIEAAKSFWLSNQSILVGLATTSGEGLAWLPAFTDWLRIQTQAGNPKDDDLPPASAPAIVTNDLWTPGRVFQDINEPWCPEMVVIPAGEFMMGSPESEPGRSDNEGPQHRVTIKKPFALGRYPVTFEAYDVFCDETDRKKPEDNEWGRGKRPVINVPWQDAATYCAWLSERTGRTYRLPSEAEWEYACRAGTTSAYAFGGYIGKGEANVGRHVGKTLDVGTYAANGFGLYDMHGNVWEWCADTWHDSYDGAPADGSAWINDPSPVRVVRGGSWRDGAQDARAAFRGADEPGSRDYDLGIRCAGVQEES